MGDVAEVSAVRLPATQPSACSFNTIDFGTSSFKALRFQDLLRKPDLDRLT